MEENNGTVIEEKEKKLGLFKRLGIAIVNLKEYDKLSNEKVGKTIWTFSLLSIIETILLTAMLVFFGMGIYQTINEYIEKIPNFSISNQGFTTESTIPYVYEMEENAFLIIIDSNSNIEEIKNNYSEKIYSATNYLLISNDQMVARTATNKDYYKFANMENGEVYTKDTFVNIYKQFLNGTMFKVICIIIVLIICIYLIITKLIIGLIYSVFAIIIAKIQNKNISYSRLFNISLYASVTTIIIGILLTVTFFQIPFWPILKFAVILIYIWFGVKYCLDDKKEIKDEFENDVNKK